MTKDQEQAFLFLQQLAQDFVNSLPVSAKSGTAQQASTALDILKKAIEEKAQ